jgi:hypothetical protein
VLGPVRADRSWRAHQQSVPDDGTKISEYAGMPRLFQYLKRAGVGTETSAYGIAGSANVVDLDRDAADVLREALCWPVAE